MKAPKIVTRQVTLTGTTPMLFDRYSGSNKLPLEAHQKFYFNPDDEKQIGIPAINIQSLLCAKNTTSAPKVLVERGWSKICDSVQCSVEISPDFIPLLRNGKPILFGGFDEDEIDATSGMRILHHVARVNTKGSVTPNPIERPVLSLPWALSFKVTILPGMGVTEELLENLLVAGGQRIGLGTWHGVFGKFSPSWG